MKTCILNISVLVLACMAMASCDKAQKEGSGAKAAKVTVELQKYYGEAGTMTLRTWSTDDKVAIFNADTESSSVSTASPISSGSQSSLFTFAMKGVGEGDRLMAYFPEAADITCMKGGLTAYIPSVQDGTITPVYVGTTSFSSSYAGSRMTLIPLCCTVYANVQRGAYSVVKAVMTANGGEKLAGKVTVSASDLTVTATDASVTVAFDEPLDCRLGAVRFPILAAPGTLASGFTITFTTDSGATFEYRTDEGFTFEMGGKHDTSDASNSASTQVIICGDNKIYHLDAELAVSRGYKNAILWEWDAKDHYQTVGLSQSNMIRLDDCKPVEDNTKILATSSKGYSVLIDKESSDVLWYSNCSTNAHSAEILPNNRIAVACSDNGDCIQVFDIGSSNQVKFSTALSSAHGVVWNPKTERLYAIGGTALNIYSLTDWNTAAPKLTLEKSINTKTSAGVSSLHDLTLVDENTLLIAGNKAALYNISQNTFSPIKIFESSTSLKSVNYNGDTGECWFTDPTDIEVPDLTWASHTIRYTDNANSTYQTASFKVEDLNIYKVRIYNW